MQIHAPGEITVLRDDAPPSAEIAVEGAADYAGHASAATVAVVHDKRTCMASVVPASHQEQLPSTMIHGKSGRSVSDGDRNAVTLSSKMRSMSSGSALTRRLSSTSSWTTWRSTSSAGTGACTDLIVSGYTIRGQEKKVMYHIDVVGHESQLETYTIRRSFSDFKTLHAELSAVVQARKEYESARIKAKQKAAKSSTKKGSETDISVPDRPNDVSGDSDEAIRQFVLPSLPPSGFLSFWRRHDRSHIQNRCELFQELLHAVLQLQCLRESYALQKFLSIAPCAIRERGSSYVSLCEYSVPQLDPREECEERKRRARECRRNSSVHAASFLLPEAQEA